MKYVRFILIGCVAAGISVMSAVAAPKKPSAQKTPVEQPAEKTTVKPSKVQPMVLDDFEREALTGWIWNARELKSQPDGGMALEQADEDKPTVFLTEEKKLVLKGKRSLQIVYKPTSDNDKKEAMVVMRESPGVMDDRDALRFQAVAAEGKAMMIVQLIDMANTVRYPLQQPIECTFRKMKTFTLGPTDFGIPEKVSADYWKDIKRVQFILKGATTMVLDQIEFVPLPKK